LAGTDCSRERAVVSADDEFVAIDRPEHCIHRTTHDARRPHDRVEYRLVFGG
jgi:hypothetical protein